MSNVPLTPLPAARANVALHPTAIANAEGELANHIDVLTNAFACLADVSLANRFGIDDPNLRNCVAMAASARYMGVLIAMVSEALGCSPEETAASLFRFVQLTMTETQARIGEVTP